MTTYKYRDEASQEIHTLQIGDQYRKWSQDGEVDPYPATFADDEGDERLLRLGKIIEVWDDATETWWPSVIVEIIDDVSFLDAASLVTERAEAKVETEAEVDNEAMQPSIVVPCDEPVAEDESRSYAYLIAHGRIIGEAFTSLRAGPVDYGRMTDGTFVKIGHARLTRSQGIAAKARKMEDVEFFAVNLGGGGSL
jgi:hypothetical protein